MSEARMTVRMMVRKKHPMLTHSMMVIVRTALSPRHIGSPGGFA